MKKFYFAALLLLFAATGFGQKIVVVIGSSTAVGTGATTTDSSWVGRLRHSFKLNTSDGVDTNVVNIAVSGTTTYNGMPSSFTSPSGRPSPDPNHNITKALSYNPDIILVNYPSNDVANGFTNDETIFNLQTIYDSAAAAGVPCFISTTQPRNFSSSTQRQQQKDQFDLINSTFGAYSMDFWTGIATATYTIEPAYSYGDGIHLNNDGHHVLYDRVAAKDIFSVPLPLTLTGFSAHLVNAQVQLEWQAANDDPQAVFTLQRSRDGVQFQSLYSITPASSGQEQQYRFTDAAPLPGVNFYRLEMRESTGTHYSRLLKVPYDINGILLKKIYPIPARGTLSVEIATSKKQPVIFEIIGANGKVLNTWTRWPDNLETVVTLPVNTLPGGSYFIRITADGSKPVLRTFTKY